MAFIGRSPVRAVPVAPRPSLEFGTTPLRVTATPSTAPQEAMAASLQAHIDELVQKNRTCEHEIRRLKQILADEKERVEEVTEQFKAASAQEREEWWEACGSFLAAHRIVHLRTQNEWEKEIIERAHEIEEGRADRLAIVQRDYKLTLFQARETELEARVAELEDLV